MADYLKFAYLPQVCMLLPHLVLWKNKACILVTPHRVPHYLSVPAYPTSVADNDMIT